MIVQVPAVDELELSDYPAAQWRRVCFGGMVDLAELEEPRPRHPYELVERTDALLERIQRELREQVELGQLELFR